MNDINTLPTDKQLAAIRFVAVAILEAVTAAGDRGIPSGHLYAVLSDKMDLDSYNKFINALVQAGKITNKGHLLKATDLI